MLAILRLLTTFAGNLFKSQRQLEVENLFLRHQLNIALRRAPHLRLRGGDRALLMWMTWLWPSLVPRRAAEKPPLEHGLTATEGRSARHTHCRLDWGASHSLAAQRGKVSDR